MLGVLSLAIAATGCRPSDDDAAGQAKMLKDPVYRPSAIGNIYRLYTAALDANHTNRDAAPVKAIADVTVGPLTQTFMEHPEDNQGRNDILRILASMIDPRSLPALVEALKWKPEVSEQRAITAAKTLALMPISADKKSQVVSALADALDQVPGARPVEREMQIEFIKALSALNDRGAVPVLTKVMLRQDQTQNFLINRVAGEALMKLGDERSLPAFVRALYLFDANNPNMRMNDLAAEGLVRIGRPAVQPMLGILAGTNAEANALVQSYIDTQNALLRRRDPSAPVPEITVAALASGEAMFTLGELGLRDSIDTLIEKSRSEEAGIRLPATTALARISRTDADTQRIRDAITHAYEASEVDAKGSILRAMQHLNDPGVMPFLLNIAKNAEEVPDLRVIALNGYAMLANKTEAVEARAIISREEEGEVKTAMAQQNDDALAAADACNVDVACWTQKLSDSKVLVARKAAYMLARLATRGDQATLRALVARFGTTSDEMIRNDVAYAIDWLAPNGFPEAVAKIEEIAKREEGQSGWNHVKAVAMMTVARLKLRAGA